ncbi:membrane protein insertase YidC [Novispirillum sp. DQ9]|uniref:membrane protein insertase YidC n=1 Tax=Novispirillum sp. DQ9 TaxID=3398612 RepID=UPI003C7A22AB
MPEQKNLILAVVLSLVIIVGFDFLWPKPETPPAPQEVSQTQQAPGIDSPAAPGAAPAVPGGEVSAPGGAPTREAALTGAARVRIDTPALSGSISLVGGRFDDLVLKNYRVEPNQDAQQITLLSPRGSAEPYYAEYGWVAAGQGIDVPGGDTPWQADAEVLSPATPVTLTWTSAQGLTFKRIIAVDENYMFTVTQTVSNDGGAAVTLHPYGLISRGYRPQTADFYILHEGPLGVFEGTLKEVDYSELEEDGKVERTTTGGWVGITDKYWLTALDFDRDSESKARMLYRQVDGQPRYQVDFLGAARTVAPGTTVEVKNDFFAGAKQLRLIDHYADSRGIKNFDLSIDFGWFYFLTKPFAYALLWLHGLLGNAGLAIIAFTVILRVLLYPLANKSFKSMSKMKALQPEMKALQERFKDDRARLNQEMMALYKTKGVNPVSGCLPILVQIPIFFALYKVLFVSIEMRHAPFYGWIHDLSAPDPTSLFNLFGLIPWDPPTFLMIGVWPLIMGVTMWAQQKLNPAPADPIQAKIMMWLPVVFTVMLASFPAGLVIYWATNNLLSVAQQWLIMKRMGVKV